MITNAEAELQHLATCWVEQKNLETAAREARIEIENQILALSPAKDEGAYTRYLHNGVKLKVQGKMSYKADLDKLLKMTADWPLEYKPIKTEISADEKILKHIRSSRPDLWRELSVAVTTKPMKTAITIEEENGL
jgi:hypothetical protein